MWVVSATGFSSNKKGQAVVNRRLRDDGSSIGILVLISFEDSPYIKAAIDAGANGFVLKSAEVAEIIEAIHAVYEASCVVACLQRKEVQPHQQQRL